MWLAKAVEGKGICWHLGCTVDVIFDMADLQDSRRCRGYRMLLMLLGYRVLLMLLVIDLCGGRKPNEALVGVGS